MIDTLWKESLEKIKKIKLVKGYKNRYITTFKEKNVVLIGMRRLGKTEYLNYRFIESDFKSEEVLFINFDDPIWATIDFELKKENFDNFNKAIINLIKFKEIKMVLFDEIQRIKDWSRWLKGFIDYFPNTTFVATGSDAIELFKTSEVGTGRYNIKFIGPLLYEEYQAITNKDDLNQYIDYFSFPQGEKFTLEQRYSNIIEKQVLISNIKKINIENILKIIAFNPGIKLTNNKISSKLKEFSDANADNKQIESILNFLIRSQLIISINDVESKNKVKRNIKRTFYTFDWNAYKYFQTIKEYEKLPTKILNNQSKIVPTKGFVFENMIISNVFSKLNTPYQRNRVFNKISNPDIDIIIDESSYEIKSFDATKNLEVLSKIIEKAHKTRAIIIHKGKTQKIENVNFINWKEFLKKMKTI